MGADMSGYQRYLTAFLGLAIFIFQVKTFSRASSEYSTDQPLPLAR